MATPLPRLGRPRHTSPRARIDARHRRSSLLPAPIDPSIALAALMRDGDFYRVGKTPYLVAPITDELLDALIVAAGATEDDEDNGDDEPSIPSPRGDDLELGIDDEPHDGDPDAEPSLVSLSWVPQIGGAK